MKISKLIALSFLLIIISSCNKEYMEDSTQQGLNNHSFELDGVKWAKKNAFSDGFNPTAIYIEKDRITSLNLISYNTSNNNEACILNLEFYLPKEYNLPLIVSFSDENIYENKTDSAIGNLHTSYRLSDDSVWEYYEKVLLGNLTITRFDSIVSGVFETQVASEKDTLTISNGKFDYLF